MAEQMNESTQEQNAQTKSKRGFASMSRDLQRQIASKGGRAAHQQGVAHEFTPEQAREAGRKGGQASRKGSTAKQQEHNEGQQNRA